MNSINKERKKLNPTNRDVFDKMLEYLSIKNLNESIKKNILFDILGMFQESQKLGRDAKDVFGDYEIFCDGIAENAIKKTKMESLLAALIKVGVALIGIVIYGVIDALFDARSILDDTMMFISNSIIKVFLAAYFATMIASLIRKKLTYRYPFGNWYIYGFVYLVIYVCLNLLVDFVAKDGLFISIYLIIAIIIAEIIFSFSYLKLRDTNFKKYKTNNSNTMI